MKSEGRRAEKLKAGLRSILVSSLTPLSKEELKSKIAIQRMLIPDRVQAFSDAIVAWGLAIKARTEES